LREECRLKVFLISNFRHVQYVVCFLLGNFRRQGITQKKTYNNRLKVFQNRLLRRIFGPKKDEVTRDWRRLQNEELNDL
jgi:hypothetical protein